MLAVLLHQQQFSGGKKEKAFVRLLPQAAPKIEMILIVPPLTYSKGGSTLFPMFFGITEFLGYSLRSLFFNMCTIAFTLETRLPTFSKVLEFLLSCLTSDSHSWSRVMASPGRTEQGKGPPGVSDLSICH